MNIHCSTCGQDLPEPQRRLAEAELAKSQAADAAEKLKATEVWVHRELKAAGLLKSDEEIAAELADLNQHQDWMRARETRGDIAVRSDFHNINDTWWLRDYEQAQRNRKRLTQFNMLARLHKLTVPMERRPASPVTDGVLGTFHHPV